MDAAGDQLLHRFCLKGVNVRPIKGLTLRAAYSQTVARPSFRELGFYVSVEPGTDDLFVGNPQLQLSDVESWDLRAEYTWGSRGDLVAASLFMKEIDDPIESIVVRNPVNAEASSSALFRTFFNNPNQGKVRGIEVEARKSLDFFGVEALEYVSIGGNFTYIDAEVDRTEAELARSGNFFGVVPGENERFRELEQTRRLFGQPKWIANADVSFDQPEWGTKATLAVFAISDVLDAAGSASIGADGRVYAFTIDRYIDSFYQLDLILSQTWRVEWLRDAARVVDLRGLRVDRFGEQNRQCPGRRRRDGRRRSRFDNPDFAEVVFDRVRAGRQCDAIDDVFAISFAKHGTQFVRWSTAFDGLVDASADRDAVRVHRQAAERTGTFDVVNQILRLDLNDAVRAGAKTAERVEAVRVGHRGDCGWS